jgi:phage shock protein A
LYVVMTMRRRRAERPLDEQLAELHDAYAWRVNAAVAAGHEDLAEALVQDFPDEALELLARSGA